MNTSDPESMASPVVWRGDDPPISVGDETSQWLAIIADEHNPHRTEEMPAIELDEHDTSPRRETIMHRIRVVTLVAAVITSLYIVQNWLWPRSVLPHGDIQVSWAWLGLVWAAAAVPAVFELIGLMLWRASHAEIRPIGNLVCYRVVSRGLNKQALCDTIGAIRTQMRMNPMFPYTIEVVMDSYTTPDPELVRAEMRRNTDLIRANKETIRATRSIFRKRSLRKANQRLRAVNAGLQGSLTSLPEEGGNLKYIIVPKSYKTPNGTLKKARALHYANEPGVSSIPPKTYIMHCDEETHPTRSSINGIAAAVREEEEKNPERPRIGQGTITYHRDLDNHLLFTLSDCIRTGSDLGRLYLSMLLGWPVFGLHGSYILIREDVEKAIGLDVGPRGSLTEDAWFGAIAMNEGFRCRWVEGTMAEQCTFNPKDFIQQRRRWHSGLVKTSIHVPTQLRWRLGMFLSMIAWSLAPLGWVYTVGHFIFGGYVQPDIRAAANFGLAVYIATTLVGLRINLREHGVTSRLRKVKLALVWLIWLPVSSLLEASAVTFSLARPAKDFHVVNKNIAQK